MERNWEEASSQRRPVCRVPEIMVDTSRERVAGDGLHVQDQPETPGGANAVARDAGTIPLADTTQGKSKGGVKNRTPIDLGMGTVSTISA